jgi:CHAD domain-containing protein
VEIPRGEFLGELKRAVESAAEDARLARTEGSLLDRPRLLLRKAIKQVRGAMEAYRQAHVREGFNGRAFGKATEDLDKARDALQKLVDGKDD